MSSLIQSPRNKRTPSFWLFVVRLLRLEIMRMLCDKVKLKKRETKDNTLRSPRTVERSRSCLRTFRVSPYTELQLSRDGLLTYSVAQRTLADRGTGVILFRLWVGLVLRVRQLKVVTGPKSFVDTTKTGNRKVRQTGHRYLYYPSGGPVSTERDRVSPQDRRERQNKYFDVDESESTLLLCSVVTTVENQ